MYELISSGFSRVSIAMMWRGNRPKSSLHTAHQHRSKIVVRTILSRWVRFGIGHALQVQRGQHRTAETRSILGNASWIYVDVTEEVEKMRGIGM